MRKVDRAKYDERRQRILEAAQQCFQRDGFRGASIAEICAAARMSPGHLYHYFGSKEAIIEALFEWRLEREAAIIGELILTPNADLITVLCEWMEQRVRDVRANRNSLGLEMRAESARNPAVAKIVSRADRATRDLMRRLIHQGQERGQVDPGLDPDGVAAVVHSIFFGLNRLGYSAFDVKGALATLKLLIERFLKPQPNPAANQRRRPARETNASKTAP